VPRRSAEDAAATRAAFVRTARAKFGSEGFAAVLTDDLVAEVGLSRGALYHHFRTKEELFAAVFEDVEAELVARVMGEADGALPPWVQLRNGLHAYLDLCEDPAVSRILFVDGPAVLGWDTWHELEEKYAFGHIVNVLQEMIDAGAIDPVPITPLAHVVFGALTRAGGAVARSADRRKARAETEELLDRVLAAIAGGSI
jgi:AcrR family transcriptional regulator